ncbi:MAG: helix-turn-helix transcriptional regulator [Clostridia bacterium]|nr:helix-turn-helix transcriptional regulator [Clostridia bacterium]
MRKYICVKLKEVRLEKGLSQKKLAELVKCSVYKIQRWEKCLSFPQLHELASLGYFLNVKIDYLLGESKYKKIVPISYFKDDEEFNTKHRYAIIE